MLTKIRQSSVIRSMLKADDLYNSVKMKRRKKKNADLLWIQESSSQTGLFNCQRTGRTPCPLGKPCVLSPATRVLIRMKQQSFQGHIPGDIASRVRTLNSNLNSASDPGSAIYGPCSMGKLIFLSHYFPIHK